MTVSTILIIILIVLLIGVVPWWPHSRAWGPTPFGAVIVALIVIVILMVLKVI